MTWRPWWLALTVLLSLVGLTAPPALAQPARQCAADQRVRALEFDGSPLYDDVTLAASIATAAPTVLQRLHFGEAPCSDSATVALDGLRLAVLHRQAGWLQATVTVLQDRRENGVRIRFVITPGPEALLDTLVVEGLPLGADGRSPLAARLLALQHQRFDRVRLDTTMAAVVMRLRDAGYMRATRPTVRLDVDSVASRVRATVTFAPGALVTIRAITVDAQGIGSVPSTVTAEEILGLTGLREGKVYKASDVVNAQRSLYRADVFRLVLIDTASPPAGAAAGDSLIDLRIAVADARTRTVRVGAGWATLECIRSQARLVDRRFLGVGRRLEVTARSSRIGVGAPADFAPSLCSRALRADTQFTVLNHYLGATVSATRLFGSPLSPVTTVYTERRTEPFAYIREISVGGLMEVSRQFTRLTSGTAGLQYENGRTKIDPAESCLRFNQCRPEEYAQSVFGRGLGLLSATVTHDETNNAIDPSRGFRARGEARVGQTFSKVDSSVRFYRASVDAATFTSMLGGVIGARVQFARAFAPGAQLVDGSPLLPQQERLFTGGQSSVRGYQQNLLGPLVYVVSDVETVVNDGVEVVQTKDSASYDRAVPRGGTALLVANLEYRRGFRWLAEQLQVAAFVDIGGLWEGATEPFKFANLRATPGLGLRVLTALGPFRVDVGYQPYELRSGRALFVSKGTNGSAGVIRCASPGNTVAVGALTANGIADCPDTYRPPQGRGVLSRLAFHFGLGQAF
ncbi:MAG: BamA/TamA family outer membrane protein [Gemmatimonadaceae bacterium]|nr:BamA/TamA family outer membrane protein [Gemmatimonadaceae bacterium]